MTDNWGYALFVFLVVGFLAFIAFGKDEHKDMFVVGSCALMLAFTAWPLVRWLFR